MQIAMIGLGRMGANMVQRLLRAGHECVVWDPSADAVQVRGFERRKPARGPLPEHLPRERIVYPAPSACPCCGAQHPPQTGRGLPGLPGR